MATTLWSWLYFGGWPAAADTEVDPPAVIGTWTRSDMQHALATGDVSKLEAKARKDALLDRFAAVGSQCCHGNSQGPIEGGAVLYLGALLLAHPERPLVLLFALRLLHALATQLLPSQLQLLMHPLQVAMREARGVAATVARESPVAKRGAPEVVQQHAERCAAAVCAPYYAAQLLLKASASGVPLPDGDLRLIAASLEARFRENSGEASAPPGASDVAADAHRARPTAQQLLHHELRVLSDELGTLCAALQALPPSSTSAETWLRAVLVVVANDAMLPRDVSAVQATLVAATAAARDEEEGPASRGSGRCRFSAVARALAVRAIGAGWVHRRFVATDAHLEVMVGALEWVVQDGISLGTDDGGGGSDEGGRWLIIEVLRALSFIFDAVCQVSTLQPFIDRALPLLRALLSRSSMLHAAGPASVAARIVRDVAALLACWSSKLSSVRCLTRGPEPSSTVRHGLARSRNLSVGVSNARVGGVDADVEVDDVIDEDKDGNDDGSDSTRSDEHDSAAARGCGSAWRSEIVAQLWEWMVFAFDCAQQVEKNIGLQRDDQPVPQLPPADSSVVGWLSSGPPEHVASTHHVWRCVLQYLSGDALGLVLRSDDEGNSNAGKPQAVRGLALYRHQLRLRAILTVMLERIVPKVRCLDIAGAAVFSVLRSLVEHAHMNGEDKDQKPHQFDYGPIVECLLTHAVRVAGVCRAAGQVLAKARIAHDRALWSSSSAVATVDGGGGGAHGGKYGGRSAWYFNSGPCTTTEASLPSFILTHLSVDAVNAFLAACVKFTADMRESREWGNIEATEASARMQRWQRAAREVAHTALRLLDSPTPTFDEACVEVLVQLSCPVTMGSSPPLELAHGSGEFVMADPLQMESDETALITTGAGASPAQRQHHPCNLRGSSSSSSSSALTVNVLPIESLSLRDLRTIAAVCHRHKGWVSNGAIVAQLSALLDSPATTSMSGTGNAGALLARSAAHELLRRFDVEMALRSPSCREVGRSLLLLALRRHLPKWFVRAVVAYLFCSPVAKNGDALLSLLHANR